MNREICLDANIFVAALTPEDNTEACQSLFSILREDDFVFYEPALIGFEVSSVLRKKVFLKLISSSDAKRALALFNDLPLLLQWQPNLLTKSVQHAQTLKQKNTYGMSYLSVAMTRDIPLVTADKDFLRKAKKLHKKIYTAEDFLSSVDLR